MPYVSECPHKDRSMCVCINGSVWIRGWMWWSVQGQRRDKLVYCNIKLEGHSNFLSSVYLDEPWPTDVKQAISVLSKCEWLMSEIQWCTATSITSLIVEHCFEFNVHCFQRYRIISDLFELGLLLQYVFVVMFKAALHFVEFLAEMIRLIPSLTFLC